MRAKTSCTRAQLSDRLAGWLLDCAMLTYCPPDLPNYIWADYTATMPTGGTERLHSNIFTVQTRRQEHPDQEVLGGYRYLQVLVKTGYLDRIDTKFPSSYPVLDSSIKKFMSLYCTVLQYNIPVTFQTGGKNSGVPTSTY